MTLSSLLQSRRWLRQLLLWTSGVACGGCVFFRNSYDECFDDESCATEATGDGDTTRTGGAGGVDQAGDGDGDGDGDEVTGGRTHGTGGEDGSGGEGESGSGGEMAAAGGTPNDGAGGVDPGSGGDGSGGGGRGPVRLLINELRLSSSGFVEIFNAGSQSLELSRFAITTGGSEPNWATACELSGAIASMAFLEVTPAPSCRGPSDCIKGCAWTLSAGDTAYLLEKVGSTFEDIVDERVYPSNITTMVGQSYSAVADGSPTFAPRAQSPGATNTAD